jgi:hypothetical protein
MAFIACGPEGLVIMNITEKDRKPTIIGTVPTLWATQVILNSNETYAYIVDQGFYLTIIDISDIFSPQITRQYPTNSTNGVALSNDEVFAYVSDGFGGVLIINVSDPYIPIYKNSYQSTDAQFYCPTVGQSGIMVDYYLGVLAMTFMIDVPSQTNLTQQDMINLTASNNATYFVRSRDRKIAYLADGAGGLRIIDAADPKDLKQLGQFKTPAATTIILSADEKTVYLGDRIDGLYILDITYYSDIY